MFRHPHTHLSPPPDPRCRQPNATDLRLDRVFCFASRYNDTFDIGECLDTDVETKVHRKTVEIPPQQLSGSRVGWILSSGDYPFETTSTICVPEGAAGWLIARSTLNRNGIRITSGLYDSGYNNGIGGLIHVPPGLTFTVAWGARIAQFVMADSQSIGTYAGDYNKKH